MKQKRLKIIISIGILLVTGFVAYLGFGTSWDNFKLQSVRLWGYFTLQNNPLLKTYDKDFKNLESVDLPAPRIDVTELLSGGPPKDGIPSIDNPKFVTAEETKFTDEEIVVGVYQNGEARAYPYGILNWHEIVNDKIGDTPISVTLCPLCDTNPVFIREVNGTETTFGVSGKLYQSCLVMYDRLTDSLWNQPWGLGVFGTQTNESLERIPSVKTTLGKWKKMHPNTKILSTDTGYRRGYFRYPYGTYYTDDRLIFPARNQHRRVMHPKEIMAYYWEADDQMPLNYFSGFFATANFKKVQESKEVELPFGNTKIKAIWDTDLETVRFLSADDELLGGSTAFGFVIPAFFGK